MPKSMFLAYLYRDRRLLVASVTQRNIANRCNVNRGTVQNALNKFEEMGAVMVLPCRDQGFFNNVYLLGFEAQNIMDIRSLYFVDSVYLEQGESIPDGIRNFIMSSYLEGPVFQCAKSAKDGRNFFEHLFGVNPESKPAGQYTTGWRIDRPR